MTTVINGSKTDMKHLELIWITLLISANIFPQWSNNPDINLQLTNWGDAPLSAVEDERGGAFISTSLNIPLNEPPWQGKLPYLLWVDKYGNHKITTSYRIGGYSTKYRDMKLMKDGTGNYFAIFVDQFYQFGPPLVYKDRIIIQKLDSLGNKLWGEGVYISTDTVVQHTFYEAVTDDKGGCFIYYEALDSLFSDNGRKLVQYMSPTGERLWGDEGITLYNGNLQWNFSANNLMYDGNNGIITIYQNNYLININNSGNTAWILPFNIPTNSAYRMAPLDKDGFIILGFKFYENPFSASLIFDKISWQGDYLDSNKTLNANIDGGKIENISIIKDNIFFTWQEYRSYLQKIDTSGNKLWSEKGILLFDTTAYRTKMFTRDSSFILVTDHYSQAINLDGENLWQPNILQYTTRYMGYYDVVSDNSGGFISFWLQYLDGIWGQQVNSNGQLGVVTKIDNESLTNQPLNFTLFQNYPNPFNPSTIINYFLSSSSYVELKVSDVLGREVEVLENGEKAEGLHSVLFDSEKITSGVYFYTILVKPISINNVIYKSTKKMLSIK